MSRSLPFWPRRACHHHPVRTAESLPFDTEENVVRGISASRVSLKFGAEDVLDTRWHRCHPRLRPVFVARCLEIGPHTRLSPRRTAHGRYPGHRPGRSAPETAVQGSRRLRRPRAMSSPARPKQGVAGRPEPGATSLSEVPLQCHHHPLRADDRRWYRVVDGQAHSLGAGVETVTGGDGGGVGALVIAACGPRERSPCRLPLSCEGEQEAGLTRESSAVIP